MNFDGLTKRFVRIFNHFDEYDFEKGGYSRDDFADVLTFERILADMLYQAHVITFDEYEQLSDAYYALAQSKDVEVRMMTNYSKFQSTMYSCITAYN